MSNKRNVKAISYSGIVTALIVVIMYLSSILSVFEYCGCLLGGLAVTFILVEFGTRYALAVYFASSLLSVLLVPTKATVILFVLFCGWYSFVKRYFDRLPKLIGTIIKLLVFNTALSVIVVLTLKFISTEPLPKYWLVPVLLLGNFCFILYDVLINRLIWIYFFKVRDKLKIK